MPEVRVPLVLVHGTKPEYRIPSMAEIAATPDNGLRVVSTFSGCGGSCLGFRMAGYRVAWASEFVPAAAEVYRLNHPDTPLSTRDIRSVTPDEIFEESGIAYGEADVLEGSPPCASYSTSGMRQRGWGKTLPYSGRAQRVDDLFAEFVRLVGGVAPRAFVAENVSGLVKGASKGHFLEILAALRNAGPGYRVAARLLDAAWLGVPQHRQRVIFVGVRSDLEREPVYPEPLPYRYSVADALPNVNRVKHGGNKGDWRGASRPAPTVTVEDWTISQHSWYSGGGWVESEIPPEERAQDLEGFAIGPEYDRLEPGESSKRYYMLTRVAERAPSATVTSLAGQTGAAGVCHPVERRKFHIPELKRICGFPDDFRLTGTFAQRWERLGRAVPPPMMRAVAEKLREVLDV